LPDAPGAVEAVEGERKQQDAHDAVIQEKRWGEELIGLGGQVGFQDPSKNRDGDEVHGSRQDQKTPAKVQRPSSYLATDFSSESRGDHGRLHQEQKRRQQRRRNERLHVNHSGLASHLSQLGWIGDRF